MLQEHDFAIRLTIAILAVLDAKECQDVAILCDDIMRFKWISIFITDFGRCELSVGWDCLKPHLLDDLVRLRSDRGSEEEKCKEFRKH